MTKLQFILLCHENLIDHNVALENDNVLSLLSRINQSSMLEAEELIEELKQVLQSEF